MLLHAVQHYSILVAASTFEEGGHILSRSSSARYAITEGPPGAPAPTSAVLLQGRHISIQQSSATGIFFPNRLFTIFWPHSKNRKDVPKECKTRLLSH